MKKAFSALLAILFLSGTLALRGQYSNAAGFEVASIHALTPPFSALKTLKISGTLVRFVGYNLPWLVSEAFEVKDYQVAADTISISAREVFYGIEARAPGPAPPTRAQVRAMLRALLAERFHLAVHREMRRAPVYALAVDKKGSALRPSSGGAECSSSIGPVRPEDRNYRYRFSNCTLEPLIDHLSADRPILDQTGLTGRYDIEIYATPEFRMGGEPQLGDISFRDALGKLGLRLDAQNAAIEVVVIDHVDPSPSPN